MLMTWKIIILVLVWGIFALIYRFEFAAKFLVKSVVNIAMVLPNSRSFKELSKKGYIELESGNKWDIKEILYAKMLGKKTVKNVLEYINNNKDYFFNDRIDSVVIQSQKLELIIIRHSDYAKERLEVTKKKMKIPKLLNSVKSLFKSSIFFDGEALFFDKKQMIDEAGEDVIKKKLVEKLCEVENIELISEPHGTSVFIDLTPSRIVLFEYFSTIAFVLASFSSVFLFVDNSIIQYFKNIFEKVGEEH
jgi:hypothetical protein